MFYSKKITPGNSGYNKIVSNRNMCRGTKQSLTTKTVAILLDVTTHVIMSLVKSQFFFAYNYGNSEMI